MKMSMDTRRYIKAEVEKRLMPKYLANKAEQERLYQAMQDFLARCENAAEAAYHAYLDEHFEEIAAFCVDNRKERGRIVSTPMRVVSINTIDNEHLRKIFRWKLDFDKEVEQETVRIMAMIDTREASMVDLLDNLEKKCLTNAD